MESRESHQYLSHLVSKFSIGFQAKPICCVYFELNEPATLNSVNQQSGTADIFSSHQSDSHNSPLAVRVHQFRANMNYMIDPLAAQVHQSGSNMDDPLAAWVHQGEVNSVMNPNGGHQIDISNENSAGPSDIDLACYRVMMNTCSMPCRLLLILLTI